ncbi:hypothetical protein GW17_00060199, partial [Ensete ventricosum]
RGERLLIRIEKTEKRMLCFVDKTEIRLLGLEKKRKQPGFRWRSIPAKERMPRLRQHYQRSLGERC